MWLRAVNSSRVQGPAAATLILESMGIREDESGAVRCLQTEPQAMISMP